MTPAAGRSERRLRVVVLGYLVRCPLGGMAWHYLQYLLGFARLGHDVWFIEDSDHFPSCYDPSRHVTDADPTFGLEFAGGVLSRLGFGDRWAYYDEHADRWHGPLAGTAARICGEADVVVNISAANPLRDWTMPAAARVFIDTDPAFEQVRQLTIPDRRARAAKHTHFFSFGENIERGTATLPDDGLAWRATRQPVALDAWPVTPGRPDGRLTTVMQWTSYPPREHAGVTYGQKSETLRELLDLPARTDARIELALGSEDAPRDLLRGHGWRLRNPLPVTRSPWTYQDYIRSSKAEFSVAKQGYVVSNSGWFSERSAAYLASGRPTVLQDTGFTEWLDAGAGCLAFTTLDEAVAAIEEVGRDYDRHCRAAREVAVEYFDSDRVLGRLLDAL